MRILPGILVGNFNEVLAGLTAVSKQGTKPIEETIQDKQTKLLLKDLRRSYQFASVSSLGPATYTLVEHPPMQAELRHLADHHEEFDFISFPMRGLLDEQNRLTEEE
ncbi:MAG TPA: hypothetical protein VLF60_03080 [Candidatus Saccharimonadales bacterium]|nr:hypothetical protein [Candidatus Saccharimonadales bacterium]